MLIFVVAGLDPLGGVFGYGAAIATSGTMILMLVSSISVLVFFRRHTEIQVNIWRGTIIPILAVIGLAFCMWLVLSNFMMVTGGSLAISILLAVIPFVLFVVGVIVGSTSSKVREQFMRGYK